MELLQSEFHYEGRGYIYEIDEIGQIDKTSKPPLEVIFVVRHQKYGADIFNTEIRPTDGDVRRAESLLEYLARKLGYISIESIQPDDYPFRIDHFGGMSSMMNTVTIQHYRYDLGHTSNYKLRDEKLIAIVKLSRCQALEPANLPSTLSYDGAVIYHKKHDREPTRITKDIGVLTLALHYDWEDNQQVAGIKAVTRIESPRIIIDLSEVNCDPTSFFNNAEEQLDSLLTLLSFFSREHVSVTSIELLALIDRGYSYPSPRRSISGRNLRAAPRRMFLRNKFHGRDFAELLKHFEQSPIHDVMVRTMKFIVSSYEIDNLESAYFLAHSAVEAICKEFTKDIQGKKIDSLPKDDYDAVKRIFTRFGEELDSKTKKRVVMDYLRVLITLDRLDIDLTHMGGWREEGWEQGWEKGVKQAFKQRNDLFHEGLVQNPNLLIQDLMRLCFIFELIALKLLGIDLSDSGYWPVEGW